MLPRNLTIIFVTVTVSLACYVLHRRTRTAMIVGEALDLIDRMYVEPIDSDDLLTAAMNGMTASLDTNSEFIPPRRYTEFQSTIEQEFAGIGIYIAPGIEDEQTGQTSPVRVLTPLVGSPAISAGILPGDEIIGVDGEDVSAMTIEDISTRLRGPIGTTVQLQIRRSLDDPTATRELTLNIRRDTIELESVLGDYRDTSNHWVYRLKEEPEIAYIRATSFGDKTVRELGTTLRELNNHFEGLILDLRGNGGGLLDAAVAVSDMFLNEGKIVSTKVRNGVLENENRATPGTLVDPDIPMAVLIDENSASASEIVAAALQDNDRAVIVGRRSYGKGTVQQILPLQYGRSALRLTVAKYLRPSGRNIHRDADDREVDDWGVRPDPGYEIDVPPEVRFRLQQLWQQASYPSLQNAPLPDPVVTPDRDNLDETPVEIPSDATAWDLDEVLRQAVKALLRKPPIEAAASTSTFPTSFPVVLSTPF